MNFSGKILVPLFAILTAISCSQPDKKNDNSLQRITESDQELAQAKIDELPQLLPINQSSDYPIFSVFQESLIVALNQKDSLYIYSILDPQIVLNFGGDYGISAFKRIWQIHNPDSPFWESFKTALDLGGYFQADTDNYIFPYLFRNLPPGYDAYLYLVSINDSTQVYLNATDESKYYHANYKIVKPISWDAIEEESVDDFFPIEITESKYTFAKRVDFRSILDYRGQFEIDGQSWKLTSWISGD